MRQKNPWVRISAVPIAITASGVPATNTAVPIKGIIRRVRVEETNSGAATTVALEIWESDPTGAATFGKVLAYAATAFPLDAEETIHYELAEGTTAAESVGTMHFKFTADTGTDSTVALQMDIEVIS